MKKGYKLGGVESVFSHDDELVKGSVKLAWEERGRGKGVRITSPIYTCPSWDSMMNQLFEVHPERARTTEVGAPFSWKSGRDSHDESTPLSAASSERGENCLERLS